MHFELIVMATAFCITCSFCSAISAARGGDHSTHRQLIAQARAVRAEAERAHEEAADSIKHVMNAGQGRGMWELDLHGLHAPEVRSWPSTWTWSQFRKPRTHPCRVVHGANDQVSDK